MALNCSLHARGEISELTTLWENSEFKETALKKCFEEARKVDPGTLSAECPESFAVLDDKEYQGLANEFCAIHPSRQPPHGTLSLTERRENKKIARD